MLTDNFPAELGGNSSIINMKSNKQAQTSKKQQANSDQVQNQQTCLISKPPRIMTALQHFRFEKQAQKMAKKKIDKKLVQKIKSISAQWQQLSAQKKSYYYQFYKKRKQELHAIKLDFRILTESNMNINPYLCYYRQRYPILAEAYPEKDGRFLTKIIAGNWKKLSALSKIQFEKQAQQEIANTKLRSQNKKQLIKLYELKVSSLKNEIEKQKQRITDRYSFKKRQKNSNIKPIQKQEQQQQQKQNKQINKKQSKQLKSEIIRVWQFKIDQTVKAPQLKRKDEIKPYNPTQPTRKQIQTFKLKKQKPAQQESEQSSSQKDEKRKRITTRSKKQTKKQKIKQRPQKVESAKKVREERQKSRR